MKSDKEIKLLIESIKKSLPGASESTDKLMIRRGFETDDSPFLWIEAFADVTNILIAAGNREEVIKHFSFFSQQYRESSEEIKNCIDACYVENLFFELTPENKKWAWDLLPENIKQVYEAMWGELPE